jgi:hypothetical protein
VTPQRLKLYEAAWLLQITINSARAMVTDGRLPNRGSGKLIYVDAVDLRPHLRTTRERFALDDLLAGHMVAPKPQSPSSLPAPLVVTKPAAIRKAV